MAVLMVVAVVVPVFVVIFVVVVVPVAVFFVVVVDASPEGSVPSRGFSSASENPDATSARRGRQKALSRAVPWWPGRRSGLCGKARGANACFPPAPGAVVASAVITDSLAPRALQAADQGERLSRWQLKKRLGRAWWTVVAGHDGSGVGGPVHGRQALGGDPGVDVRGGQAAVAEQLLDIAQVRPAFEHERGRRVPEEVAGTGLAHT